MNKKVDEEFVGIKDVYALQCLATELKRNNINEILKSDYDLLCKDYKKATKKIEKLEEENKEYSSLIEMQNKREYRSKFLKDFQKEKGKNVFPDYDEIYKRYNDYKARIDKAIENIEHELYGHILLNDEITWNKEFYTNGKLDYRKILISLLQQTLDVLKGSNTK